MDAFITDLYRLAEYCDYKVLQGEMIRDRIVVGIRDSQLSEKLQMDPNLTLGESSSTISAGGKCEETAGNNSMWSVSTPACQY